MWKYSRLAMPSDAVVPVCSVEVAHPWVYGLGIETENGNYLSPANALDYLAAKLAASGTDEDVVVMLITGDSQADFLAGLGGIAEVLPVASLTQLQRMAVSYSTLAVDRMIKPAGISGGIVPAAVLSTASTRLARSAQDIAAAKREAESSVSMDTLKSAVSDFAQVQEVAFSEMEKAFEELQGKSATAWTFSDTGSTLNVIKNMRTEVPGVEAVLTAAVMFTGEDLSGIRGMIHEYESNAGA